MPVTAQPVPQAIDKIIAVVGKNRIILKSEVDAQIEQIKQEQPDFSENDRCALLQQMIMSKMLVEQAERDSVIISDQDVEGTLDNRIRYFVSQFGSKEKLEQVSGRTIYQLKEDYRDVIKESMMAERMQSQILENVKITPAEVRAFYQQIPPDSLPFFPATVEMGQLVINPPLNPELDAYAKQKLEGVRKEIVDGGKSFETMAGIYSQDPGSRDNGGDLGTVGRGDVVSEFAAAAFKLQNGEISPIVKTNFGYHIIQMVKRQGEQAHLRHILIKPERVSGDYQKALTKLDSVRAEIVSGKITFQEAVGKYATDEMSQRTGGMIVDPQTGSTLLEVDRLDPAMALMIDSMSIGSISRPMTFTDPQTRDQSTRIVYMKARTIPHKANLKDDYSRIQDVALQQKKAKRLEEWITTKSSTFYVKVDDEYQSCPEAAKWKEGNQEP